MTVRPAKLANSARVVSACNESSVLSSGSFASKPGRSRQEMPIRCFSRKAQSAARRTTNNPTDNLKFSNGGRRQSLLRDCNRLLRRGHPLHVDATSVFVGPGPRRRALPVRLAGNGGCAERTRIEDVQGQLPALR